MADDITRNITDSLTDTVGEQGRLFSAGARLINSPEIGGAAGFLNGLTKLGQDGVVISWLSHEKNKPVSPEILLQIFGQEKIQSLAGSLGLPPSTLLSGLAAVLPQRIDSLSPDRKLISTELERSTLNRIGQTLTDDKS